MLALFVEIYETLGVHADFPDVWSNPGFDLGFLEEGSPRPRYLGRLTSDCSLEDLEAMIPQSGSACEEPEELEDWSFPAFRQKMEAAILAGKQKNQAAKDKKWRDRVAVKQAWCAQLKRTQCYLGIRPRGNVNKKDFHADPNYTWEQSQVAQASYEEAAGIRLPKLIPTDSAPYPFHQNVVFVCVDIEAWEMDHTKITEVGISTLDTLDLINVSPGEGGAEWMKKIRARHFRIAEYAHLGNCVHVAGCADNFLERFGTSEWISIKNAPQAVASCFRHPFSAPGQYMPFPSEARMIGRYGFDKQLLSQYLPPVNDMYKRNVILVGHEIKSDIEYLRNIGYDVTNLSTLLEAVDTIALFKAMKHERNTPSLGNVLLDLEMTGWHLHNAGNDAGYTMEALIGLSFGALTNTPKPTPEPEKLDAAAAEAQARLIEETEEWQIADEEGGDGGPAIPLPSVSKMKEQQSFAAGMRRASKAEEKVYRKSYNDKKRGTISGYNVDHEEDFPSLKSASKHISQIFRFQIVARIHFESMLREFCPFLTHRTFTTVSLPLTLTITDYGIIQRRRRERVRSSTTPPTRRRWAKWRSTRRQQTSCLLILEVVEPRSLKRGRSLRI